MARYPVSHGRPYQPGKQKESFFDKYLKDVFLIVMGALISTCVALASDFIKDTRETEQERRATMAAFNKELSMDIGERLALSTEMSKIKRRNINTDLDNKIAEKYLTCKEKWNSKYYYYFSMLTFYYNETDRQFFLDSIYDPLVNYGKAIEALTPGGRLDSPYTMYYGKIRDTSTSFVNRLYHQTLLH